MGIRDGSFVRPCREELSGAFERGRVVNAYPPQFFNVILMVYRRQIGQENLLIWLPTVSDLVGREHLWEFLSKTDRYSCRIISDYRNDGGIVVGNFTRQWTEWAHSHGSKTRNQAHGSPGNLIDLYATVDVPECEGFGLSI